MYAGGRGREAGAIFPIPEAPVGIFLGVFLGTAAGRTGLQNRCSPIMPRIQTHLHLRPRSALTR